MNLRHPGPKPGALPTALHPEKYKILILTGFGLAVARSPRGSNLPPASHSLPLGHSLRSLPATSRFMRSLFGGRICAERLFARGGSPLLHPEDFIFNKVLFHPSIIAEIGGKVKSLCLFSRDDMVFFRDEMVFPLEAIVFFA